MSLIAVLLGALGAIVSVFRSRWCFVIWLFPNSYWIWYNWPHVQSSVFIIMTFSCAAGWLMWGKASPTSKDEVTEILEENAIFREAWTQSQNTISDLKRQLEEKP